MRIGLYIIPTSIEHFTMGLILDDKYKLNIFENHLATERVTKSRVF